MFIFNYAILLFNYLFILHISDDSNFDSIDINSKITKNFKQYRLSLIHVNLGDKQLYIITYSSATKFNWSYKLKYIDINPDKTKENINKTQDRLKQQLSNKESAKCISDFFKDKLSQEYTRISYSMSKLTSYRAFLLFLVGAGVPLFKLYSEVFDFYITCIIFSFYYYYCISLYNIISSAISVTGVEMSTSSDYEWTNEKCNKDLATSYINDLVHVRHSATKKVSLIKGAEKYLRIIFILVIALLLTYVPHSKMINNAPQGLNNKQSFSIYSKNGEFNLVEFSSLISGLIEHDGEIYILHCEQSNGVKNINSIFKIIKLKSDRLNFIDTSEDSFCSGLIVIHF